MELLLRIRMKVYLGAGILIYLDKYLSKLLEIRDNNREQSRAPIVGFVI